MDIEIKFSYNEEEYGYEGYTSAARSDCGTLEEVSQFLTDALRGAGYSYVQNVGIEKDDGSVVFGIF